MYTSKDSESLGDPHADRKGGAVVKWQTEIAAHRRITVDLSTKEEEERTKGEGERCERWWGDACTESKGKHIVCAQSNTQPSVCAWIPAQQREQYSHRRG